MACIVHVLSPCCRQLQLKTTVNRLVAGSNPARGANYAVSALKPLDFPQNLPTTHTNTHALERIGRSHHPELTQQRSQAAWWVVGSFE
jgi:hypothetical protein